VGHPRKIATRTASVFIKKSQGPELSNKRHPPQKGIGISTAAGSYRNLAMLMVEACRCVGLPARLVSGYHLVEPKPSVTTCTPG
jgi:hypothetical protein